MVAYEQQIRNTELTAWSYKSGYKKSSDLSNELVEKSFICFASADSKIIKRNRSITTCADSFTDIIADIWKGKNVIHTAKLEGGYSTSTEQVVMALREVEEKEITLARIEFQLSELLKDLENPTALSRNKFSGKEWLQAQRPVKINEKDIVSLEISLENTLKLCSSVNLDQNALNHSYASLVKVKNFMELKISEMKDDYHKSKLENVFECSRLVNLIGVLKKDIVNLEEELRMAQENAVSSKKEQQRLNDHYIAFIIKEKNNAVALAEFKIFEMKKVLDASKKDFIQADCHVKNLKEKILELVNSVKEQTAASSMHLKSKEELEVLMKKEKMKLEAELEIAQVTLVSSAAKLEKSLITNKSITSAIKEKDKNASLMELKIAEIKKELGTSKKQCSLASSHIKSLNKKVVDLENELTQNLAISSMHLKSKQELEEYLQEEKIKFGEELEKKQMDVVALIAKLEESLLIINSNSAGIKEKDSTLTLMELKIFEMKKELEASKKDRSQTSSHNKHLKEKIVELEDSVVEHSNASATHLKSKQDLEMVCKKDFAMIEEELRIAQANVASSALELKKSLIANKSISLAIKEKDNATGRMELVISELRKELDASKKECLQAGNHIENLTQNTIDLESAVAELHELIDMVVANLDCREDVANLECIEERDCIEEVNSFKQNSKLVTRQPNLLYDKSLVNCN